MKKKLLIYLIIGYAKFIILQNFNLLFNSILFKLYYNYKKNFILNFFSNLNKKVIIYSSFLRNEQDLSIYQNNLNEGDIYLYVTEPIKVLYPYSFIIYQNKNVKKFGSVKNDIENNFCKYPLYLINFNYKNKDIYLQTNNYVKNTNINDKLFASLINSHDNYNTRKNIYNKLKEINHITCPSKLFNNCSNEELNKIGKIEYCKRFIFSLCPENFIFEGYITEKLLQACLSGCIPIYAGSFDEIDNKVFNKNRIIFYDPNDKKSINEAYNKVKFLMDNNKELVEFYQQDVFLSTAFETSLKMEGNLIEFLNN